MDSYRAISSDSHIFEPSDLWTSRVEPQFRESAPRVIHRAEDATDWWVCEGLKGVSGASGGAQTGVRFEDPEKVSFTGSLKDVWPGSYIPEAHLKDMELDGVEGSVIYPTQGLVLYGLSDGALLSALCRAYNNWLADFCRPFPHRIKGIAMLNLDEVQEAVKELTRCAKLGLAGAMITVSPPAGRSYDSAEYDPLWAAAQDLDMPLSLHVATNRTGSQDSALDVEDIPPAFFTNIDHWVRMSLAHMIFGGVFERYPRLQVVSVEQELSWAPHFLNRLDNTYTQRPQAKSHHRFKNALLPSDYFHRNVSLSFQEDALGIRDRHIIGVENLMWGSDYPHPESTFPRSRQILAQVLAECTQEEKAKIAGGNAAKIYHFD